MQVGLLTLKQKNEIAGKEFAPDSLFNPIQDANNKWVISIEEIEQANEYFAWVKDLPLIDYLPIETTIWYMNKNILLFIENVVVWGGVIAAYAMAILPLVQVIAGLAAFVFSVLSIIRIIKNWHEKN